VLAGGRPPSPITGTLERKLTCRNNSKVPGFLLQVLCVVAAINRNQTLARSGVPSCYLAFMRALQSAKKLTGDVAAAVEEESRPFEVRSWTGKRCDPPWGCR
jgi:hypothetical protein